MHPLYTHNFADMQKLYLFLTWSIQNKNKWMNSDTIFFITQVKVFSPFFLEQYIVLCYPLPCVFIRAFHSLRLCWDELQELFLLESYLKKKIRLEVSDLEAYYYVVHLWHFELFSSRHGVVAKTNIFWRQWLSQQLSWLLRQ